MSTGDPNHSLLAALGAGAVSDAPSSSTNPTTTLPPPPAPTSASPTKPTPGTSSLLSLLATDASKKPTPSTPSRPSPTAKESIQRSFNAFLASVGGGGGTTPARMGEDEGKRGHDSMDLEFPESRKSPAVPGVSLLSKAQLETLRSLPSADDLRRAISTPTLAPPTVAPPPPVPLTASPEMKNERPASVPKPDPQKTVEAVLRVDGVTRGYEARLRELEDELASKEAQHRAHATHTTHLTTAHTTLQLTLAEKSRQLDAARTEAAALKRELERARAVREPVVAD
ncbi:hypothetical protein HDU96_002932, partial [Phlyctochytrium bullatum]